MMFLKNKHFTLCLCALFCVCGWTQARAGLFDFSHKDRKEFIQARNTFNSGDYPKAVGELSEYIYKTKNIKRREARAYRLLGLAYEQLNRPEKALEVYLEALEFHHKDVPLLLAAADLYRRTNLTDRSIDLYNRVLVLEPDNAQALAGQAENYIDMGFYSKARQYYDRFFILNPQAPSINRARYAYAFLRQRDYENAFINITMAKLENPYDLHYWLISAHAYKGLGRMQDALADLDAAVLLAPQDANMKALRSMWLYQTENYAASLREAQKLLKDNPNNELALFMTYLNLQHTGRPAQARKYLQKIKDLNTDSFAHRIAEKLLQK